MTNMIKIAFGLYLGMFLAVFGLAAQNQVSWEASVESKNGTVKMHATTVRCLASIVYTLCHHYHLKITYEDVPLLSQSDLVNLTSVSASSATHGRQIFLPRGGPLSFTFELNKETNMPEPQKTLTDLLAAYRSARYPGFYKLTQGNDVWHIVPTQTLNSNGQWTNVEPVMSTLISFPARPDRTNKDVLDAVLQQVAQATGMTIMLGSDLSNTFLESLFKEEVTAIPARELLEQMFVANGGHRNWLLLYDPTFRYYVLNLF